MTTIIRPDGTTYSVDGVGLQQLIDEAKIFFSPHAGGTYFETNTTKGRKICPSCDKVIMGACNRCKHCGHVFWNRINGVNVFTTNDGRSRRCPKCGGWISRHGLICGCGHHFEPMLRASVEIQMILPEGMTLDQMEGHIRKSIKSLRRGSQPGDPLWRLAEGDVRVIHGKTKLLRPDAPELDDDD
ncbi:MAG: hypothetical protein WC919_00350 [Candidatus Paceibacterota bacterium]|jgi:hypothetical protein